MRKSLFLALTLPTVLFAGFGTLTTHAQNLSKPAAKLVSQKLPHDGKAPNFTATNINGKKVTFSNLNGKIRMVTFFYTHCTGPCPILAGQWAIVQNYLKKEGVFGKQVDFVSVTLDATHDTVPVIKKWAENFNPDLKGWYFLRPNPAQEPQILKAWQIQKTIVDAKTDLISHTILTDIVDKNGNIRDMLAGPQPSINTIENDINSLLAEEKTSSNQSTNNKKNMQTGSMGAMGAISSIKVKMTIPKTTTVGKENQFSLYVTEKGKPIQASQVQEIMFQVWPNGSQPKTNELVNAKRTGNGIYLIHYLFKHPGKYDVMYHLIVGGNMIMTDPQIITVTK